MHTSTNLKKHQCQQPFAVKILGKFYDSLVKLIAVVEPINMFNIGCGEGFDVKNISERGMINLQYCCGLDLNFEALEIAKNLVGNLRIDVINGDIFNLPIKLNKFDLILCLEVLEHLAFPHKVLEDVSQNFNGYCIFSVPNEPLYRLTRLFFKQNIKQLGNHPEHINHWSKKSFSKLILKYFIIDQIITPFPWTIVLCHKTDKL